MNREIALSAVIALTMATGQFAVAQGNGNRDEHGGKQSNSNRDQRGDNRNQSDRDQRGDNRKQSERDRRGDDRSDGNRNERSSKEGRPSQPHVAMANQHDSRGFGRAHEQERRKGRGVGPYHEYYRGDRLPAAYRHRNYVVDDWRGHHLNAPPRGYEWVQSGGDYVLIAIATGIIAQLLLGN
jgi:Ni/Co efflux regulator RcnB